MQPIHLIHNYSMEYRTYNSENCLCDRARIRTRPYIRVKRRNYWISIAKVVYPILGMDVGDMDSLRIEFLNDPARPSDWFIRKSDNGIQIKRTSQDRLYISNKDLVLAILDSCKEDDRVTFLVAKEPVEEGSDIHALLWRKGEDIRLRSK